MKQVKPYTPRFPLPFVEILQHRPQTLLILYLNTPTQEWLMIRNVQTGYDENVSKIPVRIASCFLAVL